MKANDKKPAPEPKPEEIKQKIAKDNGFDSWFELLTNADESYIESCIEEYADLFHKEKLREEFDKINCLTGYLERWLNNPLSVPPFELKDVIRESNEWIEDYLKTKE